MIQMSKQPGKGKAPPYSLPITEGNVITLVILYVIRPDRRSGDISFYIGSLEVLCMCVCVCVCVCVRVFVRRF
jgi:hypothetical protein